jgi:hypothetical protein
LPIGGFFSFFPAGHVSPYYFVNAIYTGGKNPPSVTGIAHPLPLHFVHSNLTYSSFNSTFFFVVSEFVFIKKKLLRSRTQNLFS